MTFELEKVIIKRVIGGDTEAFEELLNANQKNVYNLAFKMTGNQSDAEDITQEAFFKAYRLLRSFRGDSRFSVWLYRITYNLCIDFLRKKKRTQTLSLSQTDESGDNIAYDIPDERETPESAAIRNEIGETINESINELDDLHREILIMREVTDMSYADISKTLSISEGTVKSRLSRARKALADTLKGKLNGTLLSDNRPKNGGSADE